MDKRFERMNNELGERYRLLETLEGYQKLTPRQQNIIRASLLLQKIADLPEEVSDAEQEGKDAARHHVARWYCHAAVAALEQEMISHDRNAIPDSFFEGTYTEVPTLEDAEALILKQGFPCVVMIGTSDTYLPRTEDSMFDSSAHTALALGRDESGNIIVWEKQGTLHPYALAKLDSLYLFYSSHYWATRPLKSL